MAQIHNDKKRRVYRPEIEIEYESITQIPIILLTICKCGIRKVNCNITTDKYTVGIIKNVGNSEISLYKKAVI